MSAASTVFAIPELLEQILTSVPLLDTVRCQRVNRTWFKIIHGSALLQYISWRRQDRHNSDDLLSDPGGSEFDSELTEDDHDSETTQFLINNRRRYIYNVSTHLNPIVVSQIMKNLPYDPAYSFDPTQNMESDGFGGCFGFRPVLLRDLLQWYEANKSTEDAWGHMSLYQPPACKIDWSVPSSDISGLPFRLEAMYENDPKVREWDRNRFNAIKSQGEDLVLTLSDFFATLPRLWKRWEESEREIHFLSHDGSGCDFDQGFPEYCLESSDEEELGDEDEDEGQDDESGEKVTFGFKMTREEHREICIKRASGDCY